MVINRSTATPTRPAHSSYGSTTGAPGLSIPPACPARVAELRNPTTEHADAKILAVVLKWHVEVGQAKMVAQFMGHGFLNLTDHLIAGLAQA